MDPTSSGTSSQRPTSSSLAPIKLLHGSSDNEMSKNNINSAERGEHQWAGTSPSNEAIPSWPWEETRPSPRVFSTTKTMTTMASPQDTYYREGDQYKRQEPSSSWSSPYLSWPPDNETRMPLASNQFDTFNYDQETFENLGQDDLWTEQERITAHEPAASTQVPTTEQKAPTTPQPTPPTQQQGAPTTGKGTPRAQEQEAERNTHAELYQLGKGKKPDKPPPPAPNWRRSLKDRNDRWSVPRPPPRWKAPDPYPTPVREAPDEAPWLGIKPIMVKPPLPFDGQYNDIERFIGNCFTYFKVFASFFQVPSSRVTFAVSHLEGNAKTWWVHTCQEFWCDDDDDLEPPRFRLPSWWEFVSLLTVQFHDPASEEVHERRMFDLR
ncbi:uncharacterized protein ARMOST_21531 [Armillaria ostoyae]|uniref:DUF4939 domain-containing protein n=1 Tax=Armillaria ostoyae TaxID=47428 RepID=A0A284SAC4_ARMOS|nr:uncharacterized protein ARMOST_21531 [Armillaria ostoyae]